MMEPNEIRALISLLDDPDEEVQQQVRSRIKEEGLSLLPFIESYENDLETSSDLLDTLQSLKQELQFDSLKRELVQWKDEGAEDLLAACLIISRLADPEVQEAEVRSFISKVRQDIWLELNENLTAFEKVKVMNIILFDEYGFQGNREDYHNPDNSYLQKVIDERQGNPLSLSILYILLAESLDIPIRGVNLPNHFIVAYIDELGSLLERLQGGEDAEMDVLFYVNPYSQGAILHKAEIDDFLGRLDIEMEPRYFKPCDHIDIIKRMLNNLLHAYSKLEDLTMVEQVKDFLGALMDDSGIDLV